MAIPKRVWSQNGVPPEKVIGNLLTALDEKIIARAIAAIHNDSELSVKDLAQLHEETGNVLKRVLEKKHARQSADRERARRKALEGDKPAPGEL